MIAAVDQFAGPTRADTPPSPEAPSVTAALATAGVLTVALVASHWATLSRMAERWSSDPQYSHGFIVPVFALVVLWCRREMLKRAEWKPAWAGLSLLLLGLALRVCAAPADFEALDGLSLMPTVFGLVLLAGGWSILRWSQPALAFLAFMIPLPFSIEVAMSNSLRRVATVMSTYTLQTFGLPAMAEGNIIYIEEVPLGVEQACSGLGMLMTFFALATAMALIANAPLRDRLVLIASAIPIAILANVIRISATGVAYHLDGKDSELAQLIYHDLAGWLMMPIALLLLWLELKFMANLFYEVADVKPSPIFRNPWSFFGAKK